MQKTGFNIRFFFVCCLPTAPAKNQNDNNVACNEYMFLLNAYTADSDSLEYACICINVLSPYEDIERFIIHKMQ